MEKGAVRIKYIDYCGKVVSGYTTRDEIEEARQETRFFVSVTHDKRDIRFGRVLYGWMIRSKDIVKVY